MFQCSRNSEMFLTNKTLSWQIPQHFPIFNFAVNKSLKISLLTQSIHFPRTAPHDWLRQTRHDSIESNQKCQSTNDLFATHSFEREILTYVKIVLTHELRAAINVYLASSEYAVRYGSYSIHWHLSNVNCASNHRIIEWMMNGDAIEPTKHKRQSVDTIFH